VVSTPLPPREGISNYAVNLARELELRGNEVFIVTRGTGLKGNSVAGLDIRAWSLPFLPVYPFHTELYAFLLTRFIRSFNRQIDVVNCHSPLTLPPVTDGLVVSTVHSTMKDDLDPARVKDHVPLMSRLMKPFSVRVEERLLAGSRVITCVSHHVSEQVSEYGIDPARVSVINNGVDVKTFSPENRKEEKLIVYVGRLAQGKGLFDLVNAAKLVLANEPDYRFEIVGTGPLSSPLRRFAERLGLSSDDFAFIGFIDHSEVARVLGRASLFVLPSHHEGMPTVMLEALASGTPVVATAIRGVTEIIEDGKSGFLAPPGNPRQLGLRITQALADASLRGRIAREGRSLVETHFTWPLVAARFVDSVNASVPGALE